MSQLPLAKRVCTAVNWGLKNKPADSFAVRLFNSELAKQSIGIYYEELNSLELGDPKMRNVLEELLFGKVTEIEKSEGFWNWSSKRPWELLKRAWMNDLGICCVKLGIEQMRAAEIKMVEHQVVKSENYI